MALSDRTPRECPPASELQEADTNGPRESKRNEGESAIRELTPEPRLWKELQFRGTDKLSSQISITSVMFARTVRIKHPKVALNRICSIGSSRNK